MDAADKRMLEREALRNMIQQWNANRLDLFELSEPNENLEFHGVMRFYFQDSGQKIATKCIRVASDATVSDVIETLIEKFRPDMRMLSLGSYSLWETHGPDDERRLEPHEKPLLVQLNWHADDREGRFLLKCLTNNETNSIAGSEKGDQNFKRKLSKREKKELKKKEKLSRLKSDNNEEKRPVAEKLYTELPETSFTRSISNPEAVMRRRRHQKLERKLQQFRSKDGQPDTGGTLKIYGSSLCQDVPYKTLLLSVGDNAASVVREMLEKYGLSRHDPHHYCIVQVDTTDNSEYILEDDECPLAVVMTHPHSSSIMFHVRRRPADAQPRRRKKKTGSSAGGRPGLEPLLVEVSPDGSALENGLRVRVNDVIEVGSGNGVALQLYGPSIQARHCVVAPADGGGYQVTPLHCDAGVWLDGRPVLRPTSLQHGSLLKFGRISTFRFVDPAQENMLSRNMAQAPHYGSGSIYDSRSPTSGDNASGAMSPTSMASHQPDNGDANANTTEEYPRTMSPAAHDGFSYTDNMPPYNNNTLKLDNESLMMSQHLNESKDDFNRDEPSGQPYNDQDQASVNRTANSQYKDNYETTFDLDGNVETKSICSAKSGGSGHDNRMNASVASVTRPGQEAILPAVLEFPEAGQAQFLNAVVTRLDPHAPAFKLAPVYTLYLCARYRASTHYRPELSPTERAHKLTAFLHHVATLIHATVQERCTDSAAQAFWMANASELLHFLKCDRHISSFSLQAQDLLPTTVQNAFSNLVSCFQEELARALATLTNPNLADASEATAPTLQALASAMVLLRRCRVNAALTIQLFSHLFHYINAVCFNKLVTEPGAVNPRWGSALSARLGALTAWAERQGLELAADCHLARTQQAARLIQGEYRTPDEGRAALEACFKLNSIQVGALLSPITNADVVDACVGKARALADELYRADGRQIRLEESEWLGAALLIPGDGFSAEVVRGVPPGLAEFIAPLQRGGLCRLAHQPHAIGLWTVYMAGQRNMRPPDPRIHIIQLNKNSNGMGLSIVAAKGAGQSKLGIYIKSVVAGGAAAADGRLAAGDQLLSVDGHSLLGISQEKAAEYLVRTGPTVTLEVAKQGAVLHGLATLLHQPAYNQRQAGDNARRASERALSNSKSTPALHQAEPPNNLAGAAAAAGGAAAWAAKSRSSHNLAAAAPHDAFYQNLPALHHHPDHRWSSLRSSGSNRPQSAHFSAQNHENPPDSPLHQQNHAAMTARAAKLAEMSEEVTRRQQLQFQQKQALSHHHNQMYTSQPVLNQNPLLSPNMAPPPPLSTTQHLSQSQHLTPNQQIKNQNQHMMSPGQQMHNHMNLNQTMSPNQHLMGSNQQLLSPNQQIMTNQQMMSPNQQMMSPNPQMMSPNQQMMSPNQQLLNQSQQMLNQSQQMLNQNQMHVHPGQAHVQYASQPSPQLGMHQQTPPSQIYHNQNLTQQRYDWHSNGPPSPQRAQPPVAPKPQNLRRPDMDHEEHHPIQQPLNVSIQPEEDQYTSGAETGSLYNPWQREEREKQVEARRAAARDGTIAHLISLGSNRTPMQNQQLRALQLERDIERRANQLEAEDNTNTETGTEEEERISPERERMMSERDRSNSERDRAMAERERTMSDRERAMSERERGPPNPLPNPPKSILKTNKPEPQTNGFANEIPMVRSPEPPAPGPATGAGGLQAAVPPVPERGSSFAVMARIKPAPTSPVGRDKRVSFHSNPPPPPPASSPPREDPDRFIEEAENMLTSPATPPGPAPAQHTPGVIGAQEVYRDPRNRRLEEQRARAAAAPVPEQLSFHEKMKMFALEAGDRAEPRDKVKISRAQRDIDAVH